jgi:hypothetical protein
METSRGDVASTWDGALTSLYTVSAFVPTIFGENVPMQRIVVGIDGSENAQRALEWAAKEAARHMVQRSRWCTSTSTIPRGWPTPTTRV